MRGAQRFAVDERHCVPEQIALLAGGEERHDVRVLQLRDDLDFAPEAIAVHAGGELRRKDFDDDFSSEHAVGGDEDAAHPATGQLAVELIVGPQRVLEVFREVGHQGLFMRLLM